MLRSWLVVSGQLEEKGGLEPPYKVEEEDKQRGEDSQVETHDSLVGLQGEDHEQLHEGRAKAE